MPKFIFEIAIEAPECANTDYGKKGEGFARDILDSLIQNANSSLLCSQMTAQSNKTLPQESIDSFVAYTDEKIKRHEKIITSAVCVRKEP